MASKNNSSDLKDQKQIEDNGPKWGSYVKQNADQTFPYDAKMAAERPAEWMKMITERTSWLHRDSRYDYRTGKVNPKNKNSSFQNFFLNSKPKSSTSSSGSSDQPGSSGSGSGSGSSTKKPNTSKK